MHHCSVRVSAFAVALSFLPWLSLEAAGQIAVSANDNKVVNIDGKVTVVQNAPPDNVLIIDLDQSPPKILGEVQAGAAVVGVPQSAAISPDGSIAVVTAATKIDPGDPTKTADDNRITVIDLKAAPPAVIGAIEVGKGPSGVSFSPDGKLLLVANRAEGTVSVLTVSGSGLTAAGKVDFGNPKSGPSHVAFLPDGKSALVTRDGDHMISLLSVDGAKVTDTKKFMVGGYRPYSLAVSPKGDVAVFGNQGGGQGDTDIISVIDLKQNPPRVVDNITVGQTPEGVAMSPDGSFVAVTVMNGSQRPKAHPSYNDHGLVKVFRVDGTKLTPVAEAKVGGWGQGAAWSKDGKKLLVQSMMEKQIHVLSFNGKELTPADAIKVNGGPAGIRTAQP